jgi:hypothetical protein
MAASGMRDGSWDSRGSAQSEHASGCCLLLLLAAAAAAAAAVVPCLVVVVGVIARPSSSRLQRADGHIIVGESTLTRESQTRRGESVRAVRFPVKMPR